MKTGQPHISYVIELIPFRRIFFIRCSWSIYYSFALHDPKIILILSVLSMHPNSVI